MSLFHSYKLKRRKVDPKDGGKDAKAIHLHLQPSSELLLTERHERRPTTSDNSSSSGSCDECLDLSTRGRPLPGGTPLLMGDIPGQGDGHKTMVWTSANQPPIATNGTSSVAASLLSSHPSSQMSSEKTSNSNSPSSTSTTPQPDSSLALNHLSSVVGVVPDDRTTALSTRDLVLQQMATTNDDQNQQMICMICEDRATGLHYGIITCEGCKGFFKRTVQNKRVYTCVADGQCVITKQQRNRCQYCRFQKCLRQGMVLAAVREDRMPGGRNSGAVYNLYKVKYRKHKKPNTNGTTPTTQTTVANNNHINTQSAGILKSALTCPREAQQPYVSSGQPRIGQNPYVLSAVDHNNHLDDNRRQTTTSATSLAVVVTTTSSVPPITSASSPIMRQMNALMTRDPVMNKEESDQLLNALIECDDFQDFSSLSSLETTDATTATTTSTELSDRLCSIGDSIVYRLVQWTKRLPFYDQLPVHVHTQLLTHKWHELLVLSTCAYNAIATTDDDKKATTRTTQGESDSLEAEVAQSMANLARNLAKLNQMSPSTVISWQQLELEAGGLVQELCHVRHQFKLISLTLKEFVALKVVAMTTIPPNCDFFDTNVVHIRDKYLNALIGHLAATGQHVADDRSASHTRMTSLLNCLSHVSNAAALLLQSKMFYVPFLMNGN